MIGIARGAERIRQELFRETARRMGIHEAIVEKDFWICLTLEILFSSATWGDKLIFKGGTSLSKVFRLIDRFSEDVDLILDWRELGLSKEDPWKPVSITQQERFVKDTNPKSEEYLKDIFVPALQRELDERLGEIVKVEFLDGIVRIEYPGAFRNPSILPWIILEIGPLASWTPHVSRSISPYVSELYPSVFSKPSADVRVVTAERTFWEKATILHQEYHRPSGKDTPKRYSRHYYDLYKMGSSPCAESAIAQIGLLPRVVEFKERFYRASWSNLVDARPRSLRLVPREYRIPALEKDYSEMNAMFFHEEPPFSVILEGLAQLENRIKDEE
jgi:hypothetical protein